MSWNMFSLDWCFVVLPISPHYTVRYAARGLPRRNGLMESLMDRWMGQSTGPHECVPKLWNEFGFNRKQLESFTMVKSNKNQERNGFALMAAPKLKNLAFVIYSWIFIFCFDFALFQCCDSRIVACKQTNLWIQFNTRSYLEASEAITPGFLSGWQMAQLPGIIDPSIWPEIHPGTLFHSRSSFGLPTQQEVKTQSQNQQLKNLGPNVLLAKCLSIYRSYRRHHASFES